MPDHPTPLALMTHVKNPVPFVLYEKGQTNGSGLSYTEKNAETAGLFLEKGYKLMEELLQKA